MSCDVVKIRAEQERAGLAYAQEGDPLPDMWGYGHLRPTGAKNHYERGCLNFECVHSCHGPAQRAAPCGCAQ